MCGVAHVCVFEHVCMCVCVCVRAFGMSRMNVDRIQTARGYQATTCHNLKCAFSPKLATDKTSALPLPVKKGGVGEKCERASEQVRPGGREEGDRGKECAG